MSLAKASNGYDFITAPAIRVETRRRRIVAKAPRQNPLARLVVCWVVVAFLVLTYVGERAVILSLSYGLGDMRQKLHAAQVDTEQLQLAISELGSLNRVEEQARTELGMVKPAQVAYLDTTSMPKISVLEGQDESVLEKGTVARAGNFLQGVFSSVAKAAGR
jgi:cell division protein FtsL